MDGTVYWGVCLDLELYKVDLYQKVVQYREEEDGAVILLPKTEGGAGCQTALKYIQKLCAPPKYNYGERVFLADHSGREGTVVKIHWHFKRECCFYTIMMEGKIRKKRYFDVDFAPPGR